MEQPQPRKAVRLLKRILNELGVISIYRSPWDTKLLCLQRFVRMFAYGGSTLVLASYLSALNVSESRIGLFMTSTLIGDVVISFFLTLFGDALGRKRVLGLGALLMTGSGIVFALSSNYWILLAAAIFGVISPSGNEIGPFRAIEESTLAQLTEAAIRSDVYAWYTLIGSAGAAFGLMACGWLVKLLQSSSGWDEMRSYRMVFFAYAAIGIIKFALTVVLSPKIEAEKEERRPAVDESTGLLNNTTSKVKKPSFGMSLMPKISQESRGILLKLCILFAMDSYASGIAAQSWVVYFFKKKFSLEEGTLGSIFFVTNIIASISSLVASSIAKRIGNVKTMVFTHLPSAIALAMIGIPSTLPFALLFIILRSCSQSMDTAPRAAFLAAVILPNERTAIMGSLNVVKTMSQSFGPLTTGFLASANKFWVAFFLAGCLKATYDLGVLATFLGHKSREERAAETEAENNREESDSESTNRR